MPGRRTERARLLRRNATAAEQRLWRALRRHRAAGRQFRRQYPIGPYIVDFCCFAAKLIVELDGGQHAWQVAKDERRTKNLESRGFRVLRFWNSDVFDNLEGVVETIVAALKEKDGC